MPLDVFPDELRGLDWGVRMTPRFNNKISTSANGHEVRTNLQDKPLWDFELSYEYLPNRREGIADLERIQEFFLNCQGSFSSFLFDAPETPIESGRNLGTGNGSNAQFLMTRGIGTFSETIGGVEDLTKVTPYKNGVLVPGADFTLSDHRTIVFDTAPLNGVVVTADFKPLFRVRFEEDSQDYEQFMSRLWQLQEVGLKGVFL